MKKLGYARVSTSEQVLDLQLDALRQAGCDDLFTDTVSGVQAHKGCSQNSENIAR